MTTYFWCCTSIRKLNKAVISPAQIRGTSGTPLLIRQHRIGHEFDAFQLSAAIRRRNSELSMSNHLSILPD